MSHLVLWRLCNCLLTWRRDIARVLDLFKFVTDTSLKFFLFLINYCYLPFSLVNSWTVCPPRACKGCPEFKWKVGNCWQNYQGRFIRFVFILTFSVWVYLPVLIFVTNAVYRTGFICSRPCWRPRYNSKICRF